MEILLMVLTLLVLIGLSNVFNRFVPFIPVPLIQIALGVGAAFIPGFLHIPLNPELFLVLFIAPLLFNDGKLTPRKELWQLRAPILRLALGLVFVTVLFAGPFIHWLIPAIPLSAAFALAAILSPTDAVAVGALSGRAKLPGHITRLLEGEALMNDASGLVAFNFAIAATVTGQFSLPRAVGSFVAVAVGGVAVGALLGSGIIGLRLLLRRLGMEDVTLHVLIIILTPFLIFLIAEELRVSGILAVVTAGVAHAVERDRMKPVTVKLRIVSDSTWSVILYSLNGLVFLLLGLEIPGVVGEIWRDPVYNNGQVLGFIVLITAVLLLLRFCWVWAANREFRYALLTSLSGVRGALTLAAAFSIPLTLEGGSPFPERGLILFICAGVILLTLLTASVFLPLLTREPEEQAVDETANECDARVKVLGAGLHALREEMNDENKLECIELMNHYARRQQLARLSGRQDLGELWRKAARIRLEALEAEKKVAARWLEEDRISPELAERFLSAVNRIELLLASRSRGRKLLALFWTALLHAIKGTEGRPLTKEHPEWADYKAMRLEAISAGIDAAKALKTENNREAARSVIADYRGMETYLRHDGNWSLLQGETTPQSMELERKAIQSERNEIQRLFEAGLIDRPLAGKLRMDVNYREASLFEMQTALQEEC